MPLQWAQLAKVCVHNRYACLFVSSSLRLGNAAEARNSCGLQPGAITEVAQIITA